ncbi:MAG TPA: M20/M25/M40 family metallo-hydrolase [Caldithrix abyssi]|uniref:M20/M25/M40 family metallo-hydrolase n=1 Tax=Caldithrix abyssi TaxID=187145 RepID=A0A7V4TZM8_CALAY|nr:M20/M25/M40 family metallo-hydrolase [Caldithrix abyssi]
MNLLILLFILFNITFLAAGNKTAISEHESVKKALLYLEQIEPETIDEQIKICEIPAPPFKEQARGEYIKQRFQNIGLRNVRIDEVGNVIGEFPGKKNRPALVLSAHLDTVFPENTAVQVNRKGAILKAPGISDDARGLAVILAVARALQHADLNTKGTIYFVATVGEEGLGNLRGVRHLFERSLKNGITHFISVDDVGLKTISKPVGSNRYKVIFHGTGGHSYANFGIPNPLHALGRAIAKISAFQVPQKPKATFSVGRVGGGTSVNSIAHTAWMEVDLRSEDAVELAKLDESFHQAVYSALDEENKRWSLGDTLTVQIKTLGKRPLGKLAQDADILQAVWQADRSLGIKTNLTSGSTDSNFPLSIGIPSVTLGGGGGGSYKHSLQETFDTHNSHLGTQRVLLTVLNITGIK